MSQNGWAIQGPETGLKEVKTSPQEGKVWGREISEKCWEEPQVLHEICPGFL